MTFTAEQLLSIARNYWPSDMESYLSPERSPEVARFQALWRQELGKMGQWGAFVREFGGELPGFTVGNVTAPVDACFRCAAYPETPSESSPFRWVVVGCVSILAPVYTVYGVQYEYSGGQRIRDEVFFEPLPVEMRAPAGIIARMLEATFGVRVLPREVAETPVPLFVDPQTPPKTTLFHALFISQPASVP
ncbi:hypothetical protein JQX13_13505 [Archangium violaceum]|uniref:hypothetical protein n=1 Tax=Archangium violaceum TaxID=83451 RepID=UPI00193AE72D|nr:hypothetical protein [Archangium violaceum]QRK14261.1 hypothetical protein JQX13_13505 [Archangium violaceum]